MSIANIVNFSEWFIHNFIKNGEPVDSVMCNVEYKQGNQQKVYEDIICHVNLCPRNPCIKFDNELDSCMLNPRFLDIEISRSEQSFTIKRISDGTTVKVFNIRI